MDLADPRGGIVIGFGDEERSYENCLTRSGFPFAMRTSGEAVATRSELVLGLRIELACAVFNAVVNTLQETLEKFEHAERFLYFTPTKGARADGS